PAARVVAREAMTVEKIESKLDVLNDAAARHEGLSACAQLSLSGPSFAKPSIAPSPPAEPLVASGFGMRVHAATVVDGRDRRRLERVCRYLLRPPFAQDAIEALPDGTAMLTTACSPNSALKPAAR